MPPVSLNRVRKSRQDLIVMLGLRTVFGQFFEHLSGAVERFIHVERRLAMCEHREAQH
jgi:hypothetical protein